MSSRKIVTDGYAGVARHMRRVEHRSNLGAKVSVAMACIAGLTLAGGAALASRHEITVENDGVSQSVVTWGGTVGDALKQAGVEPGQYDLVQPGLSVSARSVSNVIVRSATPYQVTIDGHEQTLWSTAESIDRVLTDASVAGNRVSIIANRAYERPKITPLVSQEQPVDVKDGQASRQVTIRPDDDIHTVLTDAGVNVKPLDRVEFSIDGGQFNVDIRRVVRGEATVEAEVPFPIKEERTNDLFVGEREAVSAGKKGTSRVVQWQETIDGKVVHAAKVSQEEITKPKPQVVRVGTKQATSEALVRAGRDPGAQLEQSSDSQGLVSVLYRKIDATTASETTAAADRAAAAAKAAADRVAAANKAAADDKAAAQKAADKAAADRVAAQKAAADKAAAQKAAAEKAAAQKAAADKAAAQKAAADRAAAEKAAADKATEGVEPVMIAQSMVKEYGWDNDEFQCLVTLWDRESGWNHLAENSSSGAYGIPQALPGSKMASAGADWKTNPATQIAWGLNYIDSRYDTPCKAFKHFKKVNWY